MQRSRNQVAPDRREAGQKKRRMINLAKNKEIEDSKKLFKESRREVQRLKVRKVGLKKMTSRAFNTAPRKENNVGTILWKTDSPKTITVIRKVAEWVAK